MSEQVPAEHPAQNQKVAKLKSALLYILIGGLVISALISVVAILIGEFNSSVQKALLTTFIFMTHSLLVVALISADKNNRLGKGIVETTILAAVILNMLTSTVGTWGLWDAEYSWKAFMVYVLAIGTAYLISWTRLLAIKHTITGVLTYVTIGLIGLLAILLVPWIIVGDPEQLGAFFFRLIGATIILAFTSLAVTAIVNRIAVSHAPHLSKTRPVSHPIPGGMLAIHITVGVFVAMFWFYGLIALLISGAQVERATRTTMPVDDTPRYEYRQNYR